MYDKQSRITYGVAIFLRFMKYIIGLTNFNLEKISQQCHNVIEKQALKRILVKKKKIVLMRFKKT